jgi:hypothetical protein
MLSEPFTAREVVMVPVSKGGGRPSIEYWMNLYEKPESLHVRLYQNGFSTQETGSRTLLFEICYLERKGQQAVAMKVWEFMRLLERELEMGREIFGSWGYYALDNINNTEFLYGGFAKTGAL